MAKRLTKIDCQIPGIRQEEKGAQQPEVIMTVIRAFLILAWELKAWTN